MAAFKDKKNGSWYVQFRYTDWRGERQQKLKRGFATKKEAQAWEREFLMQKQADINMSFESFVALYEKDVKPKLKLNTWLSKEHIIRTKILPYFKKRKLSEITARDVIDWQNEIRQHTKSSGESYSPDYLKNVHTQLSCIFNHAIKYYGLQINPAAKAGNMGSEQSKEMLFWTKEEYLKFIDAMMAKPMLYYAFEILYWCGIREGELLALTPADFDFEKKTLRINLALEDDFQRIQSRMFMMYGVNDTDRLHFATVAGKIGNGLDEQLENFVCEHPDTKLIIIDTMQKIREVGGEAYSYASDYEIIGKLKQFADKHCICVLTVHHTRKQPAGDSFEMISGTTGLLGCADGSLLMQKKKRTALEATIDVVGRDQQDQILYLKKDADTQIWNLEKVENELHKEPPDHILESVSRLVPAEQPVWTGSPSALADAVHVGMAANALSKYLNVKSGRLLDEYHVRYENKARHEGRCITLTYDAESK